MGLSYDMGISAISWQLIGAATGLTEPLTGLRIAPERLGLLAAAYLGLLVVGIIANLVFVLGYQLKPVNWNAKVGQLCQKPFDLRLVSEIIIFLLALYFTVSFLKVAATGSDSERPIWVTLQNVFFHLAGLFFIASALRRKGVRWVQLLGRSPAGILRDALRGIVLYLMMFPFVFFYAVLSEVVLRAIGYETRPQEVVALFIYEPTTLGRLLTILLATFIAPVFEEIVFRGLALPSFARVRGIWWAIFVIGGVFASIHFHLPSLIPLFVVALALGIGYVYTGSLWVVIVAHAMFNVVNLAVLWFSFSGG